MLLESCCCGCSLRSGSLAIGIFALIINLAFGGLFAYLGIEEPDAITWVFAAVCLLNIVFAVILIVGVLKEVRGMLIAWTGYMTVMIILNLFGSIKGAVLNGNVRMLGGAVVGTAMWAYFILVVHSFAKKIGENKPKDAVSAEVGSSALALPSKDSFNPPSPYSQSGLYPPPPYNNELHHPPNKGNLYP